MKAPTAEEQLAALQLHYASLETQNFDLTHRVESLTAREMTEAGARTAAAKMVAAQEATIREMFGGPPGSAVIREALIARWTEIILAARGPR